MYVWTTDYRFRDASKRIAFVRYGPQSGWTTNKSTVNLKGAVVIKDHLDSAYQARIVLLVRALLVLALLASMFYLYWRLKRMRHNTRRAASN